MDIVPFNLERDENLYVEGDTEAFTNSFPGVDVPPEVAASFRANVRNLVGADSTAAFTAVDSNVTERCLAGVNGVFLGICTTY